MYDISLDLNADSLFTLTDKIKASLEGRISWGDTFGLALGSKNTKHLIIWTPKKSSENTILPGFDSKDGKLTLKVKYRPGAWISWIDETMVQAIAIDDYDRVHKSVQELERNSRQITDFADGVITNITVQHLGKSLTLTELAEEVLQVRLSLPTNIKTGGYILTNSEDTDSNSAKVIIPEQTHINRVHLNEDEMLAEIGKEEYDTALVVIRTLDKQYPDLLDLEYTLALHSRLVEESETESNRKVRILPTAAVLNSLEPNAIKLKPIEFNAATKEIEDAIGRCSEKIDNYMVKANPHAYQLIMQYQQGVESRLKALMLDKGQRIHNKVWDDLVIRELLNTLNTFCDFYAEYLMEHFEENVSRETTQLLKNKIEPIIEHWQLQENEQLTHNQMIQSSYVLTNQVVEHANALFHDLVFETDFIASGLVTSVDLKIYSNDVLQEIIPLPEWTSGTVREKITSIKFPSNYRKNQSNRKTAKFPGFEISDVELQEIIHQIHDHNFIIKMWIENTPIDNEKLSTYYATLWSLILNGKTREKLLSDFEPVCDINISVPDQTKRLMNLTLSSQMVVENEKDRKYLERNLNKVVMSKTGHNLHEITTTEKLAIHGDVTLSLLREELIRYDETLAKRASRLASPQRKEQKVAMLIQKTTDK